MCVCVWVQIYTQKVQWYGLPLGRETGGTENFHLQSSSKLPLPSNKSLYILVNKSSLQETTFITEKITKSCQSITFRYQYALTSGAKSDPHEGSFLGVLSWQWCPGPHWAQRRGVPQYVSISARCRGDCQPRPVPLSVQAGNFSWLGSVACKSYSSSCNGKPYYYGDLLQCMDQDRWLWNMWQDDSAHAWIWANCVWRNPSSFLE